MNRLDTVLRNRFRVSLSNHERNYLKSLVFDGLRANGLSEERSGPNEAVSVLAFVGRKRRIHSYVSTSILGPPADEELVNG